MTLRNVLLPSTTTAVWRLGTILLLAAGSPSLQAQDNTPQDRFHYFPHLAVGARWQTTITYINHSPREVTCRTDFISDHGNPLMVSFPGLGTVVSRTDVLPPGGAVHEETNVELNAALAPGWAQATCSGPVKASLLFRRFNGEGMPVGEAGVNASAVPASRFITFAEQREGKTGTGVAYANPSPTSALVTLTAKDAAGQVLASVNRSLPPGGHEAQNMASLFGLTDFSGSLEVTSAEPIVSLSLNFEADPVFSSLPPGEPDASAQGSTIYYFPHLAVGASWQTTITYINDSPQEVTCRTDFISDHGNPLMVSFPGLGTVVSRTDVLPPGGAVHEETNVELNAALAPGWAQATCSGPVKASLLFRRFNGEGMPVGEAGVNASAVPASRFITFAEQREGKTGTGVAYANPSPTSALVTLTAKDAAGQVLASVNRSLPPGGHEAQNMASLFGLTDFSGSLEVTSTEPIVSLSLNFEADPVFSSLPPGEQEEAAQAQPEQGQPDLAVGAPSVSNSSPAAGASFTLSATVSNTGNGESVATTLRYYRSTDATITTADTGVGTDAVGALAPSGSSAESISLTAPGTAGTYYYGACVGAVTDESDTSNNCSSAVTVTVAAITRRVVLSTNTLTLEAKGDSGTVTVRVLDGDGVEDTDASFTYITLRSPFTGLCCDLTKVDGGLKVTMNQAGKVRVDIFSDQAKSATLNVTAYQKPTSLTVSPNSVALDVGGTSSLSATVTDANGNAIDGQTISWTTSDSEVATVRGSDEGGTTGATATVTAVATGTATVTARNAGVSGTASVTVSDN